MESQGKRNGGFLFAFECFGIISRKIFKHMKNRVSEGEKSLIEEILPFWFSDFPHKIIAVFRCFSGDGAGCSGER